MFGGVKCDLRNAIIESDVVINVSATFGGIEIYVPSNVKIEIKSIPIFGGVDNKASTTTTASNSIIVNPFLFFISYLFSIYNYSMAKGFHK